MFEPLFARLSDRYHLVAPDYPGFGHSDWPDPKKFAYTFDHYAEIMNHFTSGLRFSSSGANTTCHSNFRNRKPIAGMFRTLRFTFSTPVISHWTRLPTRSPHWSGTLSVLHVEGSRRGKLAETTDLEKAIQRP
jgi:hypothetical protein